MKKVLILFLTLMLLAPIASAQGPENFRTHLRGRDQVPDPVDTLAQGQALFKLSADGTELKYKVIVANILNVVGAHIHLAPAGENGPIVLSMLPDPANFPPPFIPDPGVTLSGILVEGTATADDLAGPLEGMSLDDLIEAIESGNAYVNVHTVQNRSGEIRGQIR
jgi:hypothetical protein